MEPLNKSELASDFERYGLNVRLHLNKDFLREARIYRVLLISLLDHFMQSKTDFSYDIANSEHGKKGKIFLDYSIELTYEGNQGDPKSKCSDFFEEFARFVQSHQEVIPREYRNLYDAYLGAIDTGAIKILRDTVFT